MKRWSLQLLEWVGAGSFTYGCYLAHPALGFVVGGVLLVITAMSAAGSPRRRQGP